MGLRVEEAGARIMTVADRALARDEFGSVVCAAVRHVLPFDGWCLVGLDPRNGLRTFQFGGAGLESTADNAENEHGRLDVNHYSDLARLPVPIGWLSEDHPRAADSHRLNALMKPQGVSSEIRVVLRDAGWVWGALVLFRDHRGRPFTDEDTALLRQLGPTLATAARRLPDRPGVKPSTLPPGTVLMTPRGVGATTAMAQAWLDDLVPGGDDQTWPRDVTRVLFDAAHVARRTAPVAASTVVRTVSGRWLTVSASVLESSVTTAAGVCDVAVTLCGATATQVLDVRAGCRSLTNRELEVARAVLLGLAGKQIARRLDVSTWTVNDHLGAIYRKCGVAGRDAFVASLC